MTRSHNGSSRITPGSVKRWQKKPKRLSAWRRTIEGMDDPALHAAVLRGVATKARRLLSDVSDPTMREAIENYAKRCDDAADELDGGLQPSMPSLH